MTVHDILGLLQDVAAGRNKLPSWLWQAVARAVTLVCGTLFLLIARMKVMGVQLPVFTR